MPFSSFSLHGGSPGTLLAVAFRGTLALQAAWRLVMVTQFDLQKAREAVRKAKRALKDAEARFDTECTPDNTSLLMRQIRAAEREVADARKALWYLQTGHSDP